MKTTEKTCFKCNRLQPMTEFYAHRFMADGFLNKCKTCTKTDVKTYYLQNIEYYREYERERAILPKRVSARIAYAKTPQGLERTNEGKKRWVQRNPEKRKAQVAVKNALRNKLLKKMPCEICGSTIRVHGHHEDYSKPLQVIWLCPRHHTDRHKELRLVK